MLDPPPAIPRFPTFRPASPLIGDCLRRTVDPLRTHACGDWRSRPSRVRSHRRCASGAAGADPNPVRRSPFALDDRRTASSHCLALRDPAARGARSARISDPARRDDETFTLMMASLYARSHVPCCARWSQRCGALLYAVTLRRYLEDLSTAGSREAGTARRLPSWRRCIRATARALVSAVPRADLAVRMMRRVVLPHYVIVAASRTRGVIPTTTSSRRQSTGRDSDGHPACVYVSALSRPGIRRYAPPPGA